MGSLRLICVIVIEDDDSVRRTGELSLRLQQQNRYASQYLLKTLQNYAQTNNLKMKITNRETYDDYFALEFSSPLKKSPASLIYNLRRHLDLCTEWGLWVEEGDLESIEVGGHLRAYLVSVPALNVSEIPQGSVSDS